MPLDSKQYNKMGYFAIASNGSLTTAHQDGATVAHPAPVAQGALPQGGSVVCEYNRSRGTIGFGWPGRAVVTAYINVPTNLRLVPAFVFRFDGDVVQLL